MEVTAKELAKKECILIEAARAFSCRCGRTAALNGLRVRG